MLTLKTWFQLTMSVPNQEDTKNLTGHRMHVDGPQISYMNPYNNSFQEIGTHCRQKLTALQGKFVSSKKHLKMANFCVHESGLPDFGRLWRQTLDTRSTSMVPLKYYGNDSSNGLCARSVASKLNANYLDTFCLSVHRNWRESDFFGKTLWTRTFSTVIFWG